MPTFEINGQIAGQTAMLHNIEATAIENLDEKWGGLVAKKVAGLVAKGAVGYGVAKLTKSPLLGRACCLCARQSRSGGLPFLESSAA